jgi:hypothetical protein
MSIIKAQFKPSIMDSEEIYLKELQKKGGNHPPQITGVTP